LKATPPIETNGGGFELPFTCAEAKVLLLHPLDLEVACAADTALAQSRGHLPPMAVAAAEAKAAWPHALTAVATALAYAI
jgi:hypothetical protein